MSKGKNPAPDGEGHRARLKNRFAHDPLAVEDYEILELLLGFTIRRKDTKGIAKELLRRFGNLRGVLDAPQQEQEEVTGLGTQTGLFCQLLRELMARCAEGPVRRREVLASPQVVAHMARERLAGCTHEECWVALLDRGNRLLAWERLLRGTLSEVAIKSRDVLESGLRHKASAFILVHNHPGGSLEPSRGDILLTTQLRRTTQDIHIRFIDHVIVSDTGYYSMAENRAYPAPSQTPGNAEA